MDMLVNLENRSLDLKSGPRELISLAYVSSSAVEERLRADELRVIQSISAARNSSLGITGLLIVSPSYFAQVLEGDANDVDAVMASIREDRRHRDLVILDRKAARARRFGNWKMAFYDSASFGNTTVDPLLAAVHRRRDAQALQRYDRFISAVALNGAVPER